MSKFVGLRAKTYSYLIDDGFEDQKAKSTEKWNKQRFSTRLNVAI